MNVPAESSKSGRDGYARTARYLPGMVMLAPVGVVVAAAGWQDARIVTVLVGLATTVGLPVVLESFVRLRGLGVEVTTLEGSDGLWTTTQMMWPGDDDPATSARNAENRAVIARVAGRILPTSVPDDAAGRAAVVAAFDAAVADVRALTRDATKYPVLTSENAEYGMWRNMLGVRVYGLVVAGLAMAASIVLIVLSLADRVSSSTGELVVGLLVAAALAGFWWAIPTEQRVRQAAERYALALFDAARLLVRVSPAASPRPGFGVPHEFGESSGPS